MEEKKPLQQWWQSDKSGWKWTCQNLEMSVWRPRSTCLFCCTTSLTGNAVVVVFYRPFENMAGNLACDSKYPSSLFSLKFLILFDIKEFGSDYTGTNPIPYGNGLASHPHTHTAATRWAAPHRPTTVMWHLPHFKANNKTQRSSALTCDKCVCFCAAPRGQRRSARLPAPLAYTTKLPARRYGGVDQAAQWLPSGHYEQWLYEVELQSLASWNNGRYLGTRESCGSLQQPPRDRRDCSLQN